MLKRLLPKSSFARTAFLIGNLLILHQFISSIVVALYVYTPLTTQVNQLISRQIDSLFQAVPWSRDSDAMLDLLRGELMRRPGMQVFAEPEALQNGLDTAQYSQYLSEQMGSFLGGLAEVRLTFDSEYQVWVQPPHAPTLWLKVPLDEGKLMLISPMTLYLAMICFLSVFGGWWFASSQTRPLRRLQNASRLVSSGQIPKPLPLSGSTEICAVMKSFNQMSGSIAELEADRRLLLEGVSHDLRTPLTRIRLCAEMMDDENYGLRDGLIQDVEDMNQIIDQFISYIRGYQTEIFQPVSIDLLLREVAQQEVRAQALVCELSAPAAIPLQPVALKRVMSNLVENALRYGGGSITLRSGQTSKQVWFEVRDKGEGIPPEQIESLFAPFTQGDKARASAGSGLGLAIVRRIVRYQQGDVELSNIASGGLCARVTLPRSQT